MSKALRYVGLYLFYTELSAYIWVLKSYTAHNRKGFALGAVLAAEYINGKDGIFEMRDVLGLKKVEM